MRQLAGENHNARLNDVSKAFDYGYITRDEYLGELSEVTGLSREEVIAIRAADHMRNEALVQLVRELKKTYKIGLLSNIGAHSFYGELFSHDEAAELFDAVVLSSDIHVVKPHPEAFLHTAERLEVSPDECIMIDDLVDNIAGARAVSMTGIVYTSVAKLRQDLEQELGRA